MAPTTTGTTTRPMRKVTTMASIDSPSHAASTSWSRRGTAPRRTQHRRAECDSNWPLTRSFEQFVLSSVAGETLLDEGVGEQAKECQTGQDDARKNTAGIV